MSFVLYIQRHLYCIYYVICTVHTMQFVLCILRRLYCEYYVVCTAHITSFVLYLLRRLYCTYYVICAVHTTSFVLYILCRLYCAHYVICAVHTTSFVLYILRHFYCTYYVVGTVHTTSFELYILFHLYCTYFVFVLFICNFNSRTKTQQNEPTLHPLPLSIKSQHNPSVQDPSVKQLYYIQNDEMRPFHFLPPRFVRILFPRFPCRILLIFFPCDSRSIFPTFVVQFAPHSAHNSVHKKSAKLDVCHLRG